MKLINQLSKESGIPIHTIRYYEKYGLFRGKKDTSVKTNNYAWYDDEVLEKLELIKEAKAIGFSLAEIKKLLDAWYSKRLSIEKKKDILLQKMAEIEDKIQHLIVMKKMIEEGIRDVELYNC
ncbi:MAG: MerR family transcriptional regulator [Saprospiraceae bacterium]|jgi:MerR family copper efflux transcriptional regulator|nr:MerR family transcriptional regulator [Saprospiraceae bacterium]